MDEFHKLLLALSCRTESEASFPKLHHLRLLLTLLLVVPFH